MNQPPANRENKFNYAITVEYDGTDFAGFQFQNENRTVQGELERAIATYLREPITIHVSGRTDAGVHASGQVAGFATEKPIEDFFRFVYAVNAILDGDVAVQQISEMPPWFHVRFSCIAREYEYLIWNGRHRSVHREGRSLWIRNPVSEEGLQEIHTDLQALVGHHDFAAFTRLEYKEENTIRYLDRIGIQSLEDGLGGDGSLLSIRIRGNAFLHNMIRIIVGTAVDRIQGKHQNSFREILESRDRNLAGHTVSPVGLYFRHAYYSEEVQGKCHLPVLVDYPVFAKRAIPESSGEE